MGRSDKSEEQNSNLNNMFEFIHSAICCVVVHIVVCAEHPAVSLTSKPVLHLCGISHNSFSKSSKDQIKLQMPHISSWFTEP